VRGDDVGLAAFERFGDAEETDEIGAVGVEVLSVDELTTLHKQLASAVRVVFEHGLMEDFRMRQLT
jgi:hypothetical protein